MIEKIKQSRIASFVVIFIIYLIATAIGFFVFSLRKDGEDILFLLWADIAATVIVWLFGVLFKNSSIYDPYWSVAPIVMLTALAYHYCIFSVPAILLLLAVWLWGIRLTANWAYTFSNMNHQDWRYTRFKEKYPRYWQIINFGGINFMPTIVVFLAMLPAFYLLKLDVEATIFSYLAYIICVLAAVLQLISDLQMHSFRKRYKGKVCNVGLWKYSRHPNYLGEILFWWGVYFITLSVAPQYWWTGIGALANTLLFAFISIPLMEKRQLLNKPEYAEYMGKTAVLIPSFFRKR